MKNKKILVGLLIATVTTAGLSYSYAADNSSSGSTTETKNEFRKMHSFGSGGTNVEGFKRGFNGVELTDAEKTALQSMTAEQKKAFFENKMTTEKAKRDAKETVIDKLLAGQSLTADEETIRQEIIKERADRKTQMQERETKFQAIRAVLEKNKNGETLTADEQAMLDNLKDNNHGKGGFGKHR
nr:hypothetical protein [Candidatus Gracilibacteria bacterium]